MLFENNRIWQNTNERTVCSENIFLITMILNAVACSNTTTNMIFLERNHLGVEEEHIHTDELTTAFDVTKNQVLIVVGLVRMMIMERILPFYR